MKTEYPKYEKGVINSFKKTLSEEDLEILKDFLKLCSIRAGEGKLQKIERVMLQFLDIIETPIKDIKTDDVNSYLIVLNKCDRSGWTKNECKVYIKKFLKWKFKDLDMIEHFKGETIDISDKITEKNLLTEEDIQKMLRVAETYKEKAYLFLSFESGARPQEIINLKFSDLDFKDDIVDVTLYSNKTRKTRLFPLKQSKEHLWNWKENFIYTNRTDKDYIFPARPKKDKHGDITNRYSPITTTALNKLLRKLAKKSGIKKNVWNYLTRHTRATKLYEELPVPIVEKLLGHSNMYKTYAHISNKKAREEMLSKIYNVEKMTVDERNKLQGQIDELKKENIEIKISIEKDKEDFTKEWGEKFVQLWDIYQKNNNVPTSMMKPWFEKVTTDMGGDKSL